MADRIDYSISNVTFENELCNFQAIYVKNPLYLHYIFEFRNVKFELTEKEDTIKVWFECSPIYQGPGENFIEKDIEELLQAGQNLLYQIIDDLLSSQFAGISAEEISYAIQNKTPLTFKEFDAIM